MSDSEPRTKAWKRDAQTDADGMSLPDGTTCGDCLHFRRCNAIFGHIAVDQVCDWAPSRFKDREAGR